MKSNDIYGDIFSFLFFFQYLIWVTGQITEEYASLI
jgi:hypothetical protein